MSESKGVLFVPYNDTLGLLNIEDALHDPSGARKIADVSSRCSLLSH